MMQKHLQLLNSLNKGNIQFLQSVTSYLFNLQCFCEVQIATSKTEIDVSYTNRLTSYQASLTLMILENYEIKRKSQKLVGNTA